MRRAMTLRDSPCSLWRSVQNAMDGSTTLGHRLRRRRPRSSVPKSFPNLEHCLPGAAPAIVENTLIEQLPRQERRRILDECEPVDLAAGTLLCEPGKSLVDACFPLSCCISLVAMVGGHRPLELWLIGNEGMLGLDLVFDVDHVAPLRAEVRHPGTALRMPASRLRALLREHPGLHRALGHHLHVLLTQLARTAACTSFHEVGARLARWLLMSHDHAHADHFHLTHELLADMLGVQRSAVTIAAGAMQKARLISYSRGEINILDRRGLEAVACECYGAALATSASRLKP